MLYILSDASLWKSHLYGKIIFEDVYPMRGTSQTRIDYIVVQGAESVPYPKIDVGIKCCCQLALPQEYIFQCGVATRQGDLVIYNPETPTNIEG